MAVSVSPDRSSKLSAPPSGGTVRVVVIDNLHDRRQVITRILELGPPGASVVGYADDLDSACETVDRLAADAVLLEIQLPVADGLAVIGALRQARPSLWIVVCSFYATRSARREAERLGADLYLTKPVSPRDLSRALTAACAPAAT